MSSNQFTVHVTVDSNTSVRADLLISIYGRLASASAMPDLAASRPRGSRRPKSPPPGLCGGGVLGTVASAHDTPLRVHDAQWRRTQAEYTKLVDRLKASSAKRVALAV